MIDFIQSETKRIMYKCCERYAATQKMSIENVQLVLGLDEDGENTYRVCENYQPKAHLDFKGVLGVRFDFKGYSAIAPPFIRKSLLRFSESHEIPHADVKVMCVPKNEGGRQDVLLFLYNKTGYVETITFPDLFREEDIEMPNMEQN